MTRKINLNWKKQHRPKIIDMSYAMKMISEHDSKMEIDPAAPCECFLELANQQVWHAFSDCEMITGKVHQMASRWQHTTKIPFCKKCQENMDQAILEAQPKPQPMIVWDSLNGIPDSEKNTVAFETPNCYANIFISTQESALSRLSCWHTSNNCNAIKGAAIKISHAGLQRWCKHQKQNIPICKNCTETQEVQPKPKIRLKGYNPKPEDKPLSSGYQPTGPRAECVVPPKPPHTVSTLYSSPPAVSALKDWVSEVTNVPKKRVINHNGCFNVGMSGRCGLDCHVYLEGECEEPEAMLEQCDENWLITQHKQLYPSTR